MKAERYRQLPDVLTYACDAGLNIIIAHKISHESQFLQLLRASVCLTNVEQQWLSWDILWAV